LPEDDPSAHHISPRFLPVPKPNHSDFLDSEISEFKWIVPDGYRKHRFPGMPKPGFRVGLVVQQEVVGVLLVLREAGIQWADCVGCIKSIPNRSCQERFLTPCKNQGRRTCRHDHLSRSFHEGPAWIPYLLFYLNSPGCPHQDWLCDIGANSGLKGLFGLNADDHSCEEFVAGHRCYSSASIHS